MLQVLKAQMRDRVGKGGARALRRGSRVPAVLYTDKCDSICLSLDAKEVSKLSDNSSSTVVDVQFDNSSYKAVPKCIAYHPVTDEITHIELLRIKDGIKIDVPVRLVGVNKSQAIKRGGIVNFASRKIECRLTSGEPPESIEIDVENLGIGDSVRLYDVQIPDNLALTTKSNKVIVKVSGKRSLAKEMSAEAEASTASPEAQAAKTADKKVSQPPKKK